MISGFFLGLRLFVVGPHFGAEPVPNILLIVSDELPTRIVA